MVCCDGLFFSCCTLAGGVVRLLFLERRRLVADLACLPDPHNERCLFIWLAIALAKSLRVGLTVGEMNKVCSCIAPVFDLLGHKDSSTKRSSLSQG